MKSKLKNSIKLIFIILLMQVGLPSAFCDVKIKNKTTEKFRILGLFSHPGKSHFDIFKPLLEELAHRGHDLTVVSHFPRSNDSISLPNYKDIDLRGPDGIFLDVIDLKTIKHSPLTATFELFFLHQMGMKSCMDGLEKKQVQDLMKSSMHFDLIITEPFNTDCLMVLVDHFKAPFIGISTHVLMPWGSSRMTNPDNPSYVPCIFTGYTTNMNLYQRTINTLLFTSLNFIYELLTNWHTQNVVENAFGTRIPRLTDIAAKTSAMLVNTHYSLHGTKPDMKNVIEVGGIHIKPEALPDDLKKILDDAHQGLLYFSFGSMIKTSSMENGTVQEILEALGSIPHKVLWKWEDDDLKWKPSNVIIRKWLPQSAILHHPNTKAYLGHGGLLGMSEGISAGVPMCLIPFYGDQFVNAAAAENRGVAVVLEWKEINAKILRAALDKIFNDTRYSVNAKKLQKAWYDRPMTPLETAVWWTEYIARGNGNEYLKSSATSLSWYQRYLIDVGAIIIATLLIFVGMLYYSLRILLRIFKTLVAVTPENTTRATNEKDGMKREKKE